MVNIHMILVLVSNEAGVHVQLFANVNKMNLMINSNGSYLDNLLLTWEKLLIPSLFIYQHKGIKTQ